MVGQLFARMADEKLGKDLETHLPRLFGERSAQVQPNDAAEYAEPRAFDHAVATVATPELDLRFTRAGGELSLEIAAPGRRDQWKPPAGFPTWAFGRDWSALDWSSIDNALAQDWGRLAAAAG